MINQANWTFPLPRVHTGMLLGNGTTGLMVWGEGERLKITIGRADLWDHRGGMSWTERQNYRDIRTHLEANDETALRKIFVTDTEKRKGQPARPSIIPVGGIDLLLGDGASLKTGVLNMDDGLACVRYEKNGKELELKIRLDMERQFFAVQLPDEGDVSVERAPVWNNLSQIMSDISFVPPVLIDEEDKGWCQEFPVDDGICVAYREQKGNLWCVNTRDTNSEAMKKAAKLALDETIGAGWKNLEEANGKWWSAYWKTIPKIEIPNESLDFLYSYGLYKFAGLTNPTGIAATLQGPWIEDYQMPPWSSDYHFNINVQMCYWPAYKANKLDHLKPMFDLVWSWREMLRDNAKKFIGVEDGLMLPHAVDDKCVCMGGFWTGTIDQACTGWIGLMMYDYYKYSGDIQFLREKAYPFMMGGLRVFEAMLEKHGDVYELPVSVSPEYRGAAMNAWGKNASFQLACIHKLCESLIEASDILKIEAKSVWGDILRKLPKVNLIKDKQDNDMIALWDGVELEESHRHHSHLAAICPFESIDIYSKEWKRIVSDSINHWIKQGMGLWSGWCVPWASMIHSRLGNGQMAELLLEIWRKVFTNEGDGTLHDCEFSGLTLMGGTPFASFHTARKEVMQMDAGMGAIVAIQDMLVHSRRGVVHLLNGVPRTWKNLSFNGMLCEGGFLISAEKESGVLKLVTVKSQHGGTLKLANPWGDKMVVIQTGQDTRQSREAVLSLEMPVNGEIQIKEC